MKVAYITGAAKGLGNRIAEVLSEEYELALGVNKTPISGFDDALIIKGDVADPKTSFRAEKEIRAKYGRLDLFVANAGMIVNELLISTSEEDWDRSIAVNLNGIFFGIRALFELLTESKGSIVIISSILGKRGAIGSAAYTASKAGLFGLALSSAKELAPNVRVNSILPGYLDTDMGQTSPKGMEFARNEHLLKRLGSIDDVAQMVLALSKMEGVTGQIFSPDGRLSSW
ncbi:MAG: hypothetical protein COS94_04175 [Candidatus Hydrogenedentes bacterium CG07_land_8_20_14_0_80_42_17]|nr:MAG: hypothetical protein AUJ18_09080 [Candidatus Hydrogenedentes bacterium CG1_02_42_14]PIU48054.1 MAG: hypothetical protein COS94_04175 [Candidatus Hydrogenedentes bacterium CG07_land_8_20_14_0_80_42_17]